MQYKLNRRDYCLWMSVTYLPTPFTHVRPPPHTHTPVSSLLCRTVPLFLKNIENVSCIFLWNCTFFVTLTIYTFWVDVSLWTRTSKEGLAASYKSGQSSFCNINDGHNSEDDFFVLCGGEMHHQSDLKVFELALAAEFGYLSKKSVILAFQNLLNSKGSYFYFLWHFAFINVQLY